jgi:hypothetical protein
MFGMGVIPKLKFTLNTFTCQFECVVTIFPPELNSNFIHLLFYRNKNIIGLFKYLQMETKLMQTS